MRTRALLELAATTRERGLLRAGVVVYVMLAIGPAALLDFVDRRRAAREERAVLALEVVRCPAGHELTLLGAWSCPSCHLTFEGHGFGRCPHCLERNYAVPCACSRVAVNPLAEERL